MNFNSFAFFALLIPVILLYRVLPWNIGRIMLVIASYFFYGYAEPWYLLLLFYSSVVDFMGGILIHDAKTEFRRKLWLGISILGNIGFLLVFKYTDFIIGNINLLSSVFHVTPIEKMGWILPIGISFYTFQTLAYTIDVYRKKMEPCRDFITFALYVSYFPQLVAGPIERPEHLIRQVSQKHHVDMSALMQAMERILWGLIKKCVFADRLAIVINEVYADPQNMQAPVILVALFGFMMQLYLDFSAYTDIAIGIARLMGVQLAENFHHPFASRNPVAFWSRWHITLNTWFRDYVFLPLGGIKRQQLRKTMINILVVFTLTGFWHGAHWNFVLFGVYTGLGVALYQYLKIFSKWRTTKPLMGVSTGGMVLAVFIHLVYLSVGGVMFRAPDMQTAADILKGAFTNPWNLTNEYVPYVLLLAFLYIIHFIRSNESPDNAFVRAYRKVPLWATNAVYLSLLALWAYDYQVTFIYFQF